MTPTDPSSPSAGPDTPTCTVQPPWVVLFLGPRGSDMALERGRCGVAKGVAEMLRSLGLVAEFHLERRAILIGIDDERG